jgi:hypothetical protein
METHYASFFCQNCGQAIQLDPSLLTLGTEPTGKVDYRGHLSQRLSVADKLFKVVTKESKIEQPMCDECAQELLEILEHTLQDLQKESDSYTKYLQQIPDRPSLVHEMAELKSVMVVDVVGKARGTSS